MFFSLLAMRQRYLICQHLEGFFRCDLFGAFQRVVATFSISLAVDEDLDVINLAVVLHALVQKSEIKGFMLLLGQLEKLALEVDFGLLQLFKVDVDFDDAVDDDVLCEMEASVEINGTHEGLKSIATQGAETAVGGAIDGFVFDVVVEAEFFRQLIERHTTDDTGTHLGKEAFGLGGVGVEKIVAHNKLKYSIAEIFQSLVAQVILSDAFLRLRLVREG